MSLLNKFQFMNKADNLAQLQNKLKTAKILPIIKFSIKDYEQFKDKILTDIGKNLGFNSLIVRSSALYEDTLNDSKAGQYLSVLSIAGKSKLQAAINSVINSYSSYDDKNIVLVQPMARNIMISGVAMTSDPNTGYPYYVIQYSNGSDTSAVTSGIKSQINNYVILKNHAPQTKDPILIKVVSFLKELEEVCQHGDLDVEFGVDNSGAVFLFQVRPITTIVDNNFNIAPHIIEQSQRLSSFIHKENTATFSIMSDWNPAEMIGIKPRDLSYSLYQDIITQNSWAEGRFRYGYKDMRNTQLMYKFLGTPYIHLPSSFRSFIPASVDDNLTDKIVDIACKFLAKNQNFHDKVEFSVMPTCFTPTLGLQLPLTRQIMQNLTDTEWKLYVEALRTLTNQIITPTGTFHNDFKKIKKIPTLVNNLTQQDPLPKLICEAKSIASLFSGAARAAFIATSILKSLEHEYHVPQGFLDLIINDTSTIASEIIDDYENMPLSNFLNKHGHIRPGTYDIMIKSYDEDPDTYFSNKATLKSHGEKSTYQNISLNFDFKAHGLNISADDFLLFAKQSTSAREELKYWYSKVISIIIKKINAFGIDRGLSQEELSFIPINDFCTPEKLTPEYFQEKHNDWLFNSKFRVPYVICNPNDLFEFKLNDAHPNYITTNSITAPVHVIKKNEMNSPLNLDDKIVFIENADPGYDWIFTHSIAGLITAFGGENSHMAIRAREFNIPAAIGIGEPRFNILMNAQKLLLDCKSKFIKQIS